MAGIDRPGNRPGLPLKRSESRRKLLKTLATGAGAVAGVNILPKKWTTPIVDTLEVPLHAQGTTTPTMTASLVFEGVTYGPGVHNLQVPPLTDNASINSIQAALDPSVFGQNVHMDLVPIGALNDAVLSDIGLGDQNALTGDTGIASFFSALYITTADSRVGDAVGGFTATFSSSGVPNVVITLTFFD
jgi:hypothetical protein